MKLSDVLKNIPDININNENIEILDIVFDIKKLEDKKENINIENILYLVKNTKSIYKNTNKKVLIKTKQEIFEEINELLKLKVKNIVISKEIYEDQEFKTLITELGITSDLNIIAVSNIIAAEATIAINFFENPSMEMKIVAIYGDENGELLAEYIKKIYENLNTSVIYLNEREEYIENTFEFQKLLSKYKEAGIKTVLINTSAPSIANDMYLGTIFEAGIFTDISEDKRYWEYNFKTINDYLNGILKLFIYPNMTIINNDDIAADYIKNVNKNYYTYGIANKSTYNATDVNIRANDTNYIAIVNNKVERITSSIFGMDAVYASLACLTYAILTGKNTELIKESIHETYIPYNKEMLKNDLGLQILLDKTTDPFKIEKILKESKKLVTGRTVVLVSRDGLDIYDELPLKASEIEKYEEEEERIEKIKQELKLREEKIKSENVEEIEFEKNIRKNIGEILTRQADISIITTGSSKFENQNQIINDIMKGIDTKRTKPLIYLDREEAVISALYNIQKRDLIAIFGIGDEELDIKGRKKTINQREIINKFLEENKEEIVLR